MSISCVCNQFEIMNNVDITSAPLDCCLNVCIWLNLKKRIIDLNRMNVLVLCVTEDSVNKAAHNRVTFGTHDTN